MAGSTGHGTTDYYVAVAGVIPLLVITYLINLNPLRMAREVAQARKIALISGIADQVAADTEAHRRDLTQWVYWIPVFFCAVGAPTGEIASLVALYGGQPTQREATMTISALLFIGFAFVYHLLYYLALGVYRSMARSRQQGG